MLCAAIDITTFQVAYKSSLWRKKPKQTDKTVSVKDVSSIAYECHILLWEKKKEKHFVILTTNVLMNIPKIWKYCGQQAIMQLDC